MFVPVFDFPNAFRSDYFLPALGSRISKKWEQCVGRVYSRDVSVFGVAVKYVPFFPRLNDGCAFWP